MFDWSTVFQQLPKVEDTYNEFENSYSKVPTSNYNYNESDKRGVVDRLFDVLQIGNYATAGALYNLTDGDKNTGAIEGFVEGIKAGNPLGKGNEEGEKVYSDVLGNLGWNPESMPGKIAKGAVGLTGDILLDPLTYINPFSALGKITKGTGTVVKTKGGISTVKELSFNDAKKVVDRFYTARKKNIPSLDNMDYQKEIINLQKSYNEKVQHIKRGGEDLQFGMKNLPFTDKIKIGNKTLDTFNKKLVDADKLRSFGDKTIAPYYNAAISKIRNTSFAKKFNKYSDLSELAKTNPIAAASLIKLEKLMKGFDAETIAKDMNIYKESDFLSDLTFEETEFITDFIQSGDWKAYRYIKENLAKIREAAQKKADVANANLEKKAASSVEAKKSEYQDLVNKHNKIEAILKKVSRRSRDVNRITEKDIDTVFKEIKPDEIKKVDLDMMKELADEDADFWFDYANDKLNIDEIYASARKEVRDLLPESKKAELKKREEDIANKIKELYTKGKQDNKFIKSEEFEKEARAVLKKREDLYQEIEKLIEKDSSDLARKKAIEIAKNDPEAQKLYREYYDTHFAKSSVGNYEGLTLESRKKMIDTLNKKVFSKQYELGENVISYNASDNMLIKLNDAIKANDRNTVKNILEDARLYYNYKSETFERIHFLASENFDFKKYGLSGRIRNSFKYFNDGKPNFVTYDKMPNIIKEHVKSSKNYLNLQGMSKNKFLYNDIQLNRLASDLGIKIEDMFKLPDKFWNDFADTYRKEKTKFRKFAEDTNDYALTKMMSDIEHELDDLDFISSNHFGNFKKVYKTEEYYKTGDIVQESFDQMDYRDIFQSGTATEDFLENSSTFYTYEENGLTYTIPNVRKLNNNIFSNPHMIKRIEASTGTSVHNVDSKTLKTFSDIDELENDVFGVLGELGFDKAKPEDIPFIMSKHIKKQVDEINAIKNDLSLTEIERTNKLRDVNAKNPYYRTAHYERIYDELNAGSVRKLINDYKDELVIARNMNDEERIIKLTEQIKKWEKVEKFREKLPKTLTKSKEARDKAIKSLDEEISALRKDQQLSKVKANKSYLRKVDSLPREQLNKSQFENFDKLTEEQSVKIRKLKAEKARLQRESKILDDLSKKELSRMTDNYYSLSPEDQYNLAKWYKEFAENTFIKKMKNKSIADIETLIKNEKSSEVIEKYNQVLKRKKAELKAPVKKKLIFKGDSLEFRKAMVRYRDAVREKLESFDFNAVENDIKYFTADDFLNDEIAKSLGMSLEDVSRLLQLDENGKVIKATEFITDRMNAWGEKEVKAGKLSKEAFNELKDKYIPLIATDEGIKFFMKNMEKNGKFHPDLIGIEAAKAFNKHKTFKTIREANEYFRSKGIEKAFETDLMDIFVARGIGHNRLIFDVEMSEAVRKMFGQKYKIGEKIPHHTPVITHNNLKTNILKKLNYGKPKEEWVTEIPDEFLEKLGINPVLFSPNMPYIKLTDSQIKKIIDEVSFLKENSKPGTNLDFFQMNDSVISRYNQMSRTQRSKLDSEFLQIYDKWLFLYKVWNSAVNPGFHSQNAVSNAFQSFMGGCKAILNPKKYKQAYEIFAGKAPKATITVKGVKYTHKQMRDIMNRYGVISNTFFKEDIPTGLRDSKKIDITKGKLPPKYNPSNPDSFFLYKYGTKVGSTIEGTQRAVLFLDSLERGMGIEEAVEHVNKFMFDYSDLTEFEKTTMKRIIPFYTFMRKNIPLQLEQMLVNPNLYRNIDKAFDEIERMSGEDFIPDSERNEWHKDKIQLPFKVQGQKIGVNPQLPYEQLDRISPNKLLGQSTPLIKAPVELATGKFAYTGIPIDGGLDYLANTITPTKTMNVASNKKGLSRELYLLSQLSGFPINIL